MYIHNLIKRTTYSILDLISEELENIVTTHTETIDNPEEALKAILEEANKILPVTEEVKKQIGQDSQNAANKEFAIIDTLKKSANDYFDFKEKEIGEDQYNQIMRFIAQQALDSLWMEHLDTMDHLRDSVRLRGYGQRDPIVEYKKEGFGMFQNLIKDLNKQIAYTVLKVTVDASQQQALERQSDITLSSADGVQTGSAVAQEDNTIGRNEPCPCGSGKKYKKCGLINSAEHQANLAKK